jgi:hypothetical protein
LAKANARLEVIVDLPAFGSELVMSMDFMELSAKLESSIEVLMNFMASEKAV